MSEYSEYSEFSENRSKSRDMRDVLNGSDLSAHLPYEDIDLPKTSGNSIQQDEMYVKVAYYFAQGYSRKNISDTTGLSMAQLNNLMKDERFKVAKQQLMGEIVSTARTFLASAGFKAVRTLIECMDSPNDRVRLEASKDVLNRIGLRAPDQIEVISHGSAVKSMDDAELLALIKAGQSEIMNGYAFVDDDVEEVIALD